MTNVNIAVPPAVHTKLKLKAVKEEKTMEQALIEILQRKVKR
jgi:hypothetical protein